MMEPSEMTRNDLLEYIESLEQENFDLVAKVVEVINHVGWDVDGCYTFLDGDKWYDFNPTGDEDD